MKNKYIQRASGMIWRNWQLKVPSKHSSVSPKFPLALKSFTSRATLRKQQATQTTMTMTVWGLQQNPETVSGQMKQRLKYSGRPKCVPGKMAWASDTQRTKTGSLGKEGWLPWVTYQSFSKPPFNILLLKDSTSPSAGCSSAQLFLNYAQGPLTFLTEFLLLPTQFYGGEMWSCSSFPGWRVHSRGTAATGRACAHLPTDGTGTYQMSSTVVWMGVDSLEGVGHSVCESPREKVGA